MANSTADFSQGSGSSTRTLTDASGNHSFKNTVEYNNGSDQPETVSESSGLPVSIRAANTQALEKAEDDAHSSGDYGIMALAVRSDSVSAKGADGDYVPLLTDDSGRLHTTSDSSQLDDSAFTPTSSKVSVLGAFADETAPDAVDEGDAGALRMSLNRNLYVQLRDAAGNERGLNIDANGEIGVTNSDLSTLAGAVSGSEMQVDVVAALPAGENHLGSVAGNTSLIEVTPTISTSAYASGDQLGGLQTLTGALRVSGGTGVLENITVLDKDKEASAMTIFFFDDSPTVASSDNAALSISDAEMADKCIGHVSLAAIDYKSISGSSIATVRNVGLALKAASGTSLYAIAMIEGTPTYGGTADLVFRYGILQD